ncbi:het-domain-containing protein [Fusarium circinatum]|uniref:Het-domain-containing protein n=1 Tax=Fusarium circinatum TaxID=48490 RepID=A0A8H5WXN0_FUSCI|nr:het-domain-containing protein [Fusarium circinatum]
MTSLQIDLIEPPRTPTYTSYLPPLKYEKLPTPTSIRLLKIDRLPSIKDDLDLFRPITCSLVVKDLNDQPKYDALSYTWGNPLGGESSSSDSTVPSDWATTPFGIACSGQRVEVTTNLHTALIAIRYHLSKPQKPISQVPFLKISEYIWVDQICINQADIAEKNSQVQLMGRIYRQCSTVQIWLGGYQKDVSDMQYVYHLVQGFQPRLDSPTGHMFKSFDITNPWNCESFHVRPVTPENARGMLDFINRAWFKRSWIIQEALLAPKSNVLFGASDMPFDDLSNFVRSLGDSSWFRKLTLTASHKYPGSLATSNFFNRLHRVAYRLGTRSFDSHDQYWKQPLPIDTVTRMFRACEATDPRDKVYAFIGITENDGNQKGPQVLPDYSQGVEDIYIDTTKLIMSSEGFNLDCFSQKEDGGLRRIESLPSWIPDYSVDLGHNPLVERGWMFAAGPRVPKSHIQYLPSDCIELRGSRVDAVRLWKGEVVSERPFYVGPEFDRQTYPTIHLSTNDIVELMSLVRESSSIGPPSIDPSYKEEHDAKNCSPVTSTTIQIAASPEQTTSYQSRSEVFWRTMMKDIGNIRYPAEDSCGEELFRELEQGLYLEMAGLLYEYKIDSMTVDEWKAQTGDAMKRFTDLQIIKGVLPYGTTDTQNPKHYAGARSVMLSRLENRVNLLLWGYFLRYRENLDARAQELRTPEAYRLDVKEEVFITAKGRGLFVTDDGRLGWGLPSTQAGDEVWILEGCRIPCLLRPSGDGRYKLVGEAYVHGIMHGEALEEPGVKKLGPVIIV